MVLVNNSPHLQQYGELSFTLLYANGHDKADLNQGLISVAELSRLAELQSVFVVKWIANVNKNVDIKFNSYDVFLE